jgi:ElaB/YqjD/DUF883 family membrane-anchored ribosome-binding protein
MAKTADDVAFDLRTEITALREKMDALMEQRVAPAARAVVDEAESLAQRGVDSVRHEADRLGGSVREHPFVALGAAALAGFVIATLLRR